VKKYILLTLILTVVVIGPFVYQRWSEAKRLRHIRETKHLAAQIQATSLVDYLHQLKQMSPDSTPLLFFTGNTQAQLEPCGCFIGQSGGLPRRAKVISVLRESGFSALLIDLGGIQPSHLINMKPHAGVSVGVSTNDAVILRDQHRVQTTLTAMEMMGYDAVFPFDTEIKVFQKPEVDLSFPFLNSNLAQTSDSYLIKKVGEKRIGVVGLSIDDTSEIESVSNKLNSLLSEIQRRADFVVGLSHSSPEINRALARKYSSFSAILSPHKGETEKIGDVLLAYCPTKGKALGTLMLTDKGIDIQYIALTEQVADDSDVRKLLDDFYHQVATDHQLQTISHRLFASEPLEQDDKNNYIGSQACQECHQKEFSQWSHSSHATAFHTLRTVGRESYPECVTCHVTGSGYESGYQIGNVDRAHLVDVGCETCHGPGKQHVYTPVKENIRGPVPEKVCMECHTPEHSPGFDQLVEHVMPEVDHSRTALSLKQILEQRMRGPMKPAVELFVMSYCPYAVQAEQELLPFFEKYGDAIDFKLRFVVGKAEASAGNGGGAIAFTSLRGEPELIENKRQMVIGELYPEKLFAYLLCRADHLEEAWVNCAKDVGLDVGRIAQATQAERITSRLIEEVQRKDALNIKGSPTLVIDGRVIDGNLWLCPSFSSEEIIETLGKKYSSELVIDALKSLSTLEQQGSLFSNIESSPAPFGTETSEKLKLLVLQRSPYAADITLAAGGVSVAHQNLVKSLEAYASLDVVGARDEKFNENVQGIGFQVNDRAALLKVMRRDYDGVLLESHQGSQFFPLLDYIDAPFVVPLHAARGHNSDCINTGLLWYAAMRPFDAFLVPTTSVRDLYRRFVCDTDMFHAIPWGVDHSKFHPLEKQKAKHEVAKMLNAPEIATSPVVGFFSRFQPEKGAGIFIKIAKLLPEVCFLMTAPTLNFYEHQQLPPNLIYAPQQPREQLARLINAFDVYCFPSMVGEETFGLALLETMACGVPPVVPRLDGLPEVVGDAGLIVPARTYDHEIGSFAGTVSPDAMSDAVKTLLTDEKTRLELGQKARERALTFTWEKTAQNVIALFRKLKRIQALENRYKRHFAISFAPYLNNRRRQIESRAILNNITPQKERPLMRDRYAQPIAEGLSLALLRKHGSHEVEAVLGHLYGQERAEAILEKVLGFQESTSG